LKLIVEKSSLAGSVEIPASKSHTIRAVAIASLAEGTSLIRNPLSAADTLSAVSVYRALGAEIEVGRDWIVHGPGGELKAPAGVIDVGNSGTTLYIAMGSAALTEGPVVMTGDAQIRNRPAQPLIDALGPLGVRVLSERGDGKPPLEIHGPLHGGDTELDGSKTSQYLTSLLINCPLAPRATRIRVRRPVELPYIEMTMGWLDSQSIHYFHDGFELFDICGSQNYHGFDRAIPGDFSSATFFLCAAAITGSRLFLRHLDMNDAQGDKAVVGMLKEMGARVECHANGIEIQGDTLRGGEFDLNATPDALPAMAVTACFAEGKTRLVNVPQARLKETDRIRVMAGELTRMGGQVRELPDGLEIEGRPLRGASVHGWGDHRVVMALAVAGLASEGRTEIDTAEAAGITFPNFVDLMVSVGATMQVIDG